MDIVLNREGGVSVRDQIVTQLEMRILAGLLAPGQKLPSVRSLARRLSVHPNTVSSAYRDLEAAGHVALQRGAGVFVRRGGPSTLDDARGLDEMIRLALRAAFLKGFSGPEIRAAVERWLAASPPDRILVVDPVREMAELLVHEVHAALGLPVSGCTMDDLARDPALVSGTLALCLPYHIETLRRLVPGVALEVVNLEFSEKDRKAVLALPEGTIALVVSHSPTVLPYASVLLKTLRGDEIHVETRRLSDVREWKRLVRAADLVYADALSVEAVRKARPRRLQEVRVVSEGALARLRAALRDVVPRLEGPAPS